MDHNDMKPQQAFVRFVNRVLTPEKSERFTSLSVTTKGQRKILDAFCHNFGPAILPSSVRAKDYEAIWDKPCFVFSAPTGFGIKFSTVRNAYESLSLQDSWLILLTDASAGIHRPEGRWDDEKFIVA